MFTRRICRPPYWMRERVRSRIKSRPSDYEEAQSDTHFCVADATHHNIHFCWADSHDLFNLNPSICAFIQYACIETYINNFIVLSFLS